MDTEMEMDVVMNYILTRFLAVNKYPEVRNGIFQFFVFAKEIDIDAMMDRVESLLEARTKSEMDYLLIGWHFLGWNKDKRDLKKAEYWMNACPTLSIGIIANLVIGYMLNENMSYRIFCEKYTNVLDKLVRINLDNTTNEMVYRLLKLMSGWLRDHSEYSLSEDYLQICEWCIAHDGSHYKIDPVEIDKLINRWVSEDRRMELVLLRNFVVGEDKNEKLEHLIGSGKKNLHLTKKK